MWGEADASDADIDAVSLDLKGGAPWSHPEAEKQLFLTTLQLHTSI